MERLKSSYALQQKADEFDVYDLIDEIEEDILDEERRGYGEWQNHICVLPNFPEVRKRFPISNPLSREDVGLSSTVMKLHKNKKMNSKMRTAS